MCRSAHFLCRGPAFFVSAPSVASGPGGLLRTLSLSGPGTPILFNTLCVLGRSLCRGPVSLFAFTCLLQLRVISLSLPNIHAHPPTRILAQHAQLSNTGRCRAEHAACVYICAAVSTLRARAEDDAAREGNLQEESLSSQEAPSGPLLPEPHAKTTTRAMTNLRSASPEASVA